MVTGDHALTAAAIARQVGILTQPTVDQLCEVNGCAPADVPDDQISAIVVEGSKLDSYTEVDWDRTLAKPEIVFARTTPQQKLQIVENLQRLNHCVAVTGDGVNDSPALKKADVGVVRCSPRTLQQAFSGCVVAVRSFLCCPVGCSCSLLL